MKKLSFTLLSILTLFTILLSLPIQSLAAEQTPEEPQTEQEYILYNYQIDSYNEKTGYYKAVNHSKNDTLYFTNQDTFSTKLSKGDLITAIFEKDNTIDSLLVVFENPFLVMAEDYSIVNKSYYE